MLDADYQRHFKVLGKLCKLYDDEGADTPSQQALLAAFVDQYADGVVDSLIAIGLFPTYTARWQQSINNGAVALQKVATDAAAAYLSSSAFIDSLTTVPAQRTGPGVLTALQTEMSAAHDDKTLTALAATGFVHFFDVILGAAGTWNTDVDLSADYKDSVYVVAAVVP